MEYLLSPLALRSAYQAFYGTRRFKWIAQLLPSPERLGFPRALEGACLTPPARAAIDDEPTIFSPSATAALASDKVQEINRFILAAAYANSLRDGSLAPQLAYRHRQAAGYFADIVNFCHQHNIDLQVYRSPQPPLFWALLEHFGLADQAADWYQTMIAQTPVWDFVQSVDFNPTVDEMFEREPLHFSQRGGEIILSEILRRQNDADLTQSPGEAQLAINRRAALLEQWKSAHPDIAAAVNALPVNLLESTPWVQELLPQLMDPEYRDYRVVKILGRYVAVPAIKPPYDGYRLLGGAYPGMVEASSAAGIFAAINRQTPDATGCIVTLPPSLCPARPGMLRVFEDKYDGSGSSQARCLARAEEFASWCKATGPVAASFYHGADEVRFQAASANSD
jgi:hypothetical protein